MTTNRRRVLLAIPQVLLFGGMLVMLAVHPNAFTSALHSTRALVVNGVLLAGWLLVSLVVVPRLLRNAWWDAAILTAVAIVALAVLVVPTLHDTKVVEAFPAATVEEMSAPSPAETVPGTATATTTVAQPVTVSTGTLRGIDHDATGRASVHRRSDGSLVVGLEDIDIEPGPDYRVYVVRGDGRRTTANGTDLGGLRGNQGTQFYEVPRDVDVGAGWTVLVWCRAFGVPVANATQS